MDGSQAPPAQNLTGKLHEFGLAALHYAKARVELLQHEIMQEKSRLAAVLIRGAAFAIALLTTYQLFCAFVIVAFWDSAWRLHAVGVLVLINAGLAYAAWLSLRARAGAVAQPLAATIAEFDKDRVALQGLVKPEADPGTRPWSSSTSAGGQDARSFVDDLMQRAPAPVSSSAVSSSGEASNASKPVGA